MSQKKSGDEVTMGGRSGVAGNRLLSVGLRRDTTPVPAVTSKTSYIEIGAVVIGVEDRILDTDILNEHFSVTESEGVDAGWSKTWAEPGRVDDRGVSIHVFAADTRDEYLRFDAFEGNPHYHYIVPGSHHVMVPFDDVAEPNFVGWVVERLKTRLSEMLRCIPATELADRIEMAAVRKEIPAVETAIAGIIGSYIPA